MTEHKEVLSINPEDVSVGDFTTGFGAVASGMGRHEGYTFLHVSNVDDLIQAKDEIKRSHDLNPSSVYVVGVGMNKQQSRKKHKPIFNNQKLGIWVRRNESV